MTSHSTTPTDNKPQRNVMQVLWMVLKWIFKLFLWLIGLVIFIAIIGDGPIKIVAYLAFGWINFIMKNLATVELNLELLAQGIACTVALGIGAHYFVRWLYRETGASIERTWRWQWTASGLTVVLLLFVAGIGTIGVVHQTAWLLNAKEPLMEYRMIARARVSEAVIIGSGAKSTVQDYYASKGRLPQSGEEAGYPQDTAIASKVVSTVEIRGNGVVVVTLTQDRDWPDGSEITFTPSEDNAAKRLTWKCRSTLPSKLLPAECRG
jgi:hypothetical protein